MREKCSRSQKRMRSRSAEETFAKTGRSKNIHSTEKKLGRNLHRGDVRPDNRAGAGIRRLLHRVRVSMKTVGRAPLKRSSFVLRE